MKKRRLKIRSSYEPNRLGKIHLSDAYATLTPTVKQPINSNEAVIMDNKEEIIQLLRGDSTW
jgi:hypothetical protein